MSAHHCHAVNCPNPCEPERLMCPGHWFMVPTSLQQAVWAHYREGQCDDKNPSVPWHIAADAAIGYVAHKEGLVVSRRQMDALKLHDFKLRNGQLTRAL